MQLERWRAVSSCINFSIFGGLVLKSTISTGQSASRTDRVGVRRCRGPCGEKSRACSRCWAARAAIGDIRQGYRQPMPVRRPAAACGSLWRCWARMGAPPRRLTGAARRVSIVLRRSRNTWTAIALRGERRRAERSTDGTAVPVSRLYAGAGPGQRPSRLRNSAGPPTFSPFSGSLLSGLMALTTLTTRPTDLRCAAAGARPRQRDRAPRSRRSRRPHSG